MNKILITIATLVFISCNSTSKKDDKMKEENKSNNKESVNKDTIPKVTGIGGIFFFSNDKEKTKKWYSKNLGLETNQWG